MKVNNIIYTPISLWADFTITEDFKESYISEFSCDNITYKNLYFSGRKIDKEEVRIYATIAIPLKNNGKVIVVSGEPSKFINVDVLTMFANMGYVVIMPDLYGLSEDNHFTIYPSVVSYANYSVCKNQLLKVETSVKETCWYEWASVIRYCIGFAKNVLKAERVGLYGIKTGADIAWTCIDNNVDCFISLQGAGWQIFNSTRSYSDPYTFTDEQRKFVAGIEAESYAPYVKCPVLFLAPTNSIIFDSELAMDTLARLSKKSYCDFSPRMRYYLDSASLNSCKLFFEKHLCNKDINLYSSPEITISVKDDVTTFNVEYDTVEDIESLEFYFSTHVSEVFGRDWQLLSKEILFKYTIDTSKISNSVSTFVRVKYKNGYTTSSPITTKSLPELKNKKLINVLYSGRSQTHTFACLKPLSVMGQDFFKEKEVGVEIKQGAFGLYGAYCKSGLINYSIGASSPHLNSSFMIKFDFYSEKYNNFTVSLLTCEGEDGVLKEYKISNSVKGARVWNNFCESLVDFKDENGKSIKDFSSIYAITFYSDEEFLISNLLVL